MAQLDAKLEAISEDDVAFLQYTSGSTSAPKGVMITYGNMTQQLHTMCRVMSLRDGIVTCWWVPHFHDLGLIGGIMGNTYVRGHAVMFSPLSFLKRPAMWLEVVSQFRVAITAAPDFAYRILNNKVSPSAHTHLDLSCLELVMSAGEVISCDTVQTFLKTFSVLGLNSSSFCTAYGMAEHTVGISYWGDKVMRFDSLSRSAVTFPLIPPSLTDVARQPRFCIVGGRVARQWLIFFCSCLKFLCSLCHFQ